MTDAKLREAAELVVKLAEGMEARGCRIRIPEAAEFVDWCEFFVSPERFTTMHLLSGRVLVHPVDYGRFMRLDLL